MRRKGGRRLGHNDRRRNVERVVGSEHTAREGHFGFRGVRSRANARGALASASSRRLPRRVALRFRRLTVSGSEREAEAIPSLGGAGSLATVMLAATTGCAASAATGVRASFGTSSASRARGTGSSRASDASISGRHAETSTAVRSGGRVGRGWSRCAANPHRDPVRRPVFAPRCHLTRDARERPVFTPVARAARPLTPAIRRSPPFRL